MDQNVSLCLVQTNGILETIVTNICTGQIARVPYGPMDLIAFSVAFVIGFGMVGFFAFAVWRMRKW